MWGTYDEEWEFCVMQGALCDAASRPTLQTATTMC